MGPLAVFASGRESNAFMHPIVQAVCLVLDDWSMVEIVKSMILADGAEPAWSPRPSRSSKFPPLLRLGLIKVLIFASRALAPPERAHFPYAAVERCARHVRVDGLSALIVWRLQRTRASERRRDEQPSPELRQGYAGRIPRVRRYQRNTLRRLGLGPDAASDSNLPLRTARGMPDPGRTSHHLSPSSRRS
ncbi:uncharacterized protein UV8b_05376 [Ustilaginoidea virens]|uniref:Uncharacterized protein n=1 Tax=Ustilaginoidea virens TaxID=1159556 RepID=A0A8E5HT99_USTVR|nr:uncharacterized protein UV8b_05376 [Ustilaginoidea virens]QUC21133.1 hypothetical protein UV8b_05376 [Ustilaginoidea virens]